MASVISLKDYDFIRRYKLAVAAVGRCTSRSYRIYVTYAFRFTHHTQYADAVRVSDINQSGLYVKHTMNVETQEIANILCLKDYGMSTEPEPQPTPAPALPSHAPTRPAPTSPKSPVRGHLPGPDPCPCTRNGCSPLLSSDDALVGVGVGVRVGLGLGLAVKS